MPSWWKIVAPWLAPVLLGGVALTQFAFTQVSSLSPWKGGGFGMFSTVDSPGARFLRIQLLTRSEEIPIFVPDNLRETAFKLRIIATEQLAEELARVLSEGTWVKLRLASAVQYYQHLLQRVGQDDQIQELATEVRRLGHPVVQSIGVDDLNFVRMLSADEVPNDDDEQIDVIGVRVEIWKYLFDRSAKTLQAQNFLEKTWPVSQ